MSAAEPTGQRGDSTMLRPGGIQSRNEKATSWHSSTLSTIPDALSSAPSVGHSTAKTRNRRRRRVSAGSNKPLSHRIPLINRQYRQLHSLLSYSSTKSNWSMAKLLVEFIGLLLDWRASHEAVLRELITPPTLPIRRLSSQESHVTPVQPQFKPATSVSLASSLPGPLATQPTHVPTAVREISQRSVPVAPRPSASLNPKIPIASAPTVPEPLPPSPTDDMTPVVDVAQMPAPVPPPIPPVPRRIISSYTIVRNIRRIPPAGSTKAPPTADQPRTAPSEVTSQQCTVCLTESQFIPTQPPTSSCTHPAQVCRPCLVRTIETVVLNGDPVEGMRCPTLECRAVLSYGDVEIWSRDYGNATTNQDFERGVQTQSQRGNALFEKYQRALVRNVLVADGEFVWCTGEGCDSGQYHASGNDRPMITCNACEKKQCFRHKIAWHEGYTCLQWDVVTSKNAYTDDLSHKKIVSITKACPGKDCKQRIEKNGGCFTMTCARPRGCGTYFCWECLGLNCIHYDNCQYYSGNPGANPTPHRDETWSFRATISKRNPQRVPIIQRWKFWKREKEGSKPIRGDPLAFKLSGH